jgi:5-methylcytosine-specific restriction endonuclease McrA
VQAKPVIVTCASCGATLTRNPHRVERNARQFCNRSCKDAWQRTGLVGSSNPHFGKRRGEQRMCATCGTGFYVYPSYLSRPGRKNLYCSIVCRAPALSRTHKGKVLSQETRLKISETRRRRGPYHGGFQPKPRVQITCHGCAVIFTPNRRERRDSRSRRHFCGTDCWYDYLREHPEIHNNYRGGQGHPYGPNWREQAYKARERDRHICQDCGLQRKRPLHHVHHIVPRRLFGDDYERANVLPNLVTLCSPCHIARERHLSNLWQEQDLIGGLLLYTSSGAEIIHLTG